MPKWEYLHFDSYKDVTNIVLEDTIRFQEDNKKKPRAFSKTDCYTLDNYLKLLGDNSWELVSVIAKQSGGYYFNYRNETEEYRYFFKRPVNE
jgi:hypothetical protein